MLLIGESGTGKELLAAHIHSTSPFAAGPFVKVNCAAIPTELLESELFGHEKGAFTGATAARRGKFELADGGTIFLDEVGDLHGGVAGQAAARAAGGRVPPRGRRADHPRDACAWSRPPTATWPRMVAQEKFREDLYYRLSVVPIRVPALRERPQDIRLLAEYFLEEFCARNNFRPKVLDDASSPCSKATPGRATPASCATSIERMAILTPGERLTRDSIPVEIRVQREAGAEIDHSGGARIGRARAHPAGAGGGELERLGRGAGAGHGAHQPAQADPRPGPHARKVGCGPIAAAGGSRLWWIYAQTRGP